MRTRRRKSITVGEFYQRFGDEFKLRRLGADGSWEREIVEPTVNRPGLAIAGFTGYFASQRIQVLGSAERAYIEQLGEEEARRRAQPLLACEDLPCIVMARGYEMSERWVKLLNDAGIPVFVTEMVTMDFIAKVTVCLEREFAEKTSLHGCMVDIHGIGLLIRGKSGVGKSEAVIGLIERGGSLIADDLVRVENISGRLICSSANFARGFVEMRGIGIVNVANLYGLGAIQQEKSLDLIISLRPFSDLNKVDRLGLERKQLSVLGVNVPHVDLPVAPGRDLARLVEVAAMDQRLKTLGHDMADEFNKKLIEKMERDSDV